MRPEALRLALRRSRRPTALAVLLLVRSALAERVALLGLLALLGPAVSAFAQAPLAAPLEDTATATCVAKAAADDPARGGHAVLDCVGRAARACIAKPGQDNTLGMVECLDAERRYWDARLNAAYARQSAVARRQDAERTSIRGAVMSQEAALKAMQRAWIVYRDAACLHEQAQWMGGTGGGPATMACHLHETARQALRLEGWWSH